MFKKSVTNIKKFGKHKFNEFNIYLADISLTLASGIAFLYFFVYLKRVKISSLGFIEDKLMFFTRKAKRNVEVMSSLDIVKLMCITQLQDLRNQQLVLMQTMCLFPGKQLPEQIKRKVMNLPTC